MEVTLERLKENGAYAYEAIFLTQLKSYTFGQMSSNDFILYAPTVENYHCIFHNKADGLYVEILKSSPGVLIINGKKYISKSVVHLNNNDIVNIGLLLKYKVKMKTAIPVTDHADSNDVKSENEKEEDLPYQNVNDPNVENLENGDIPNEIIDENTKTTSSDKTIQSEISQKVKDSFVEIEPRLSVQEIDEVLPTEIVKVENEFENSSSYDSSAETETYHSSSESKDHEFATEAADDFSFQQEQVSDSLPRKEHLPDSLSEKEPLSDVLSEKVHLPNSSTENKQLPVSSSEEKNLPSPKNALVSSTNKILCVKIQKLSSDVLEKYNSASVSKIRSSDSRNQLSAESLQKKPTETNQSEESFRCEFCDKIFARKLSLDNHLLLREFNRACKFNKCDNNASANQQSLQNHSVFHNTKMPFVCDICGKRYKRKKTISVHMKTAHSELNYTCEICKKAFARKCYLKQHKLIHSKEKGFKCFCCDKFFLSRGYRRQHMMIHDKEKKFRCSYCDRCFKLPSSLSHHVRKLHTKKGLIKCKLCDKEFLHPKRLIDHQRVHTREKPYPCETCGNKFQSMRYLRLHVKRHFTCNECQEMFVYKSQLREHMRVHFPKKSLASRQSISRLIMCGPVRVHVEEFSVT